MNTFKNISLPESICMLSGSRRPAKGWLSMNDISDIACRMLLDLWMFPGLQRFATWCAPALTTCKVDPVSIWFSDLPSPPEMLPPTKPCN